ncbi:GNAT family N-acetyltransferase [Rheinheimera sp. MMS21-TC3]|uniref:GNAT family N-acetyltransferase n=1 Tax=Rheinheimera sp. MMS21-TC3 TaxID=3072790 RepID=UPI0028C43CA7|nr:GNAT family N-acetyltransferase [Rheinheimera sp. MMS21-TC3]WNO60756.1 GNAT family N-acetyltransferase [Rheinheimera sp. MMS21-TC3]
MPEFIADHTESLATLAKQKIAEFNALHWDASLRQPLGLKKLNDAGEVIAVLTGRTFGNWFYLESFWLDKQYRGQGLGKAMLVEAEQIAKQRGCRYVLLDTLNFQAKPFYQQLGYQITWTQLDYPFDGGAKYFMQKTL